MALALRTAMYRMQKKGVRTDTNFLMAMEKGGFSICGMADLFLFLKPFCCRLQVKKCGSSHACL